MGQCVGKQGRKRKTNDRDDSPAMAEEDFSSAPTTNVATNHSSDSVKTPPRKSPRKSSSSARATSTNNDNSNGPSAGEEKTKSSKKKKDTVYSKKNVEKLFDKFKDEPESTEGSTEPDPAIGPEGIERLCKELEIDPEDVVLLILAYQLNASEMGYFYRDEWVNGLEKLKLDTIDKLKSHVEVMRRDMDDPDKLKAMYRWLFGFAKSSPEQKCIDIETAIGLLGLFLAPKFTHAKHFVEFLQSHPGSVKALNLDQWTSLYEFAMTVKGDFSNYDENGAWPCIMDEYVQWKTGKGDKNDATDTF